MGAPQRGYVPVRVAVALVALGWPVFCAAGPIAEISAPAESPIYDADPDHLWNRLDEALFVRTAPDGTRYGLGRPDILFWSNTQHLLQGPSHTEAVRLLDEFIRSHGERLIRDPLKRALLQRDLWQLFDWTAPPWPNVDFPEQRAVLQGRLAVIIRRLALSDDEIAALPDNYARAEASDKTPGLPHGLFESEGNWLIVGAKRSDPTAAIHATDFGGRSIFLVMVRFPEGRQQAISYLDRLRRFERPLILVKTRLTVNPELPQFPANTEWALVRRLCVIDTHGEIRPTALIEALQLRRYVSVPTASAVRDIRDGGTGAQRFAEFEMDRRRGAALRPIGPDERDFQFVHFRSMGFDPLECVRHHVSCEDPSTLRKETLGTCSHCHGGPGVLSVNSYVRVLFETGLPIQPLEHSTSEEETAAVLNWKHRQFDWGLLQGLWRQVDQVTAGSK